MSQTHNSKCHVDWFNEPVHIIKAMPPHEKHFSSFPFRGIRVGRQGVWNVFNNRHPGTSIYIKINLNQEDFSREYAGLTLAQSLCSIDDRFFSPKIIDAEPESGLIITESFTGTSLSEFLRNATRIDKNPGRSKKRFNDLMVRIKLLRKWMDCFSALPCPPNNSFIDHGPAFSVLRAQCNRQSISLKSKKWRILAPRIEKILTHYSPVYHADSSGLLHGDLSPGNILFRENKICVLDFEDIGYGPRFRDPLWFAFILRRSSLRWLYFNQELVLNHILPTVPYPHLSAIYNLDFELMRLEKANRDSLNATMPIKKLFHYLEISDCLMELERLAGILE